MGNIFRDYEIYPKPKKGRDKTAYINGEQVKHYTFQQDYYF
ncbi:MAG: hypothetical protein U5L45_06725 [Saprospiraceae bacterium]|nr:hypothetical protein [Saprospiraceae bacterium]